MKVDVEGYEWPLIRNLLDPAEGGANLRHIKQLIIELHTPPASSSGGHNLNMNDFIEIIYYFIGLKAHGFLLYGHAQKNICCGDRFSEFMPQGKLEKCCYEAFFFNTNFQAKA